MICPDCPSVRTARELVFSESFWPNVGFTLLPFVVVAIVVAAFARYLDRDAS